MKIQYCPNCDEEEPVENGLCLTCGSEVEDLEETEEDEIDAWLDEEPDEDEIDTFEDEDI